MEIWSAVPGSNLPGDLLYSKKVPLADINVALPFAWTRIPVDSTITIDSLGFFVSFIQDDNCIVLIEETGALGPFSNQTYEILAGSWANYRNASNSEGLIRAVVNLDQALTTEIEPQLDNLSRFTVYPNPNRGRFTVDLALDRPSNVELRVMDVNGRKVSHQILKQISSYQQELDFTHLSAGIYFIQLTTDQGAEARRIVIE
jgi:hypothetical protein